MSRFRIKLAVVVAVVGAVAISSVAIATRGGGAKVTLSGYEEVPMTISSPASGKFRIAINERTQQIAYKLKYSGFETDVTQAHIHFGARATSGGVSVWLCANNPPITTAPAGTQACPPRAGTVTGTIAPANVVGPAAQGIAAGEFGELVAAIRAGVTYVNVHTTAYPPGEIRAQLGGGKPHHYRSVGRGDDYGEYGRKDDRKDDRKDHGRKGDDGAYGQYGEGRKNKTKD